MEPQGARAKDFARRRADVILGTQYAAGLGGRSTVLAKRCAYCHVEKPFGAFHTRRASRDGLSYKCRDCERAYRIENREHYRKLKADWHQKHVETERAKALANYRTNRAHRMALHAAYLVANKEAQRAYIKAHLAEYNARAKKSHAKRLKRFPVWLSKTDLWVIEEFYKTAKRLSEETGISHHVDHIVPLQGELVSGLHVWWNLQVIPAVENIRKKNKFCPL